jgi:hypothetical protein
LRNKLERELPDLLRDPVVRRKLVAKGAVIPRLVGLSVRGRQDGDGLDDDATHFSASDLPLTFNEIGHASQGAQKLLGQLATIPELLRAAINLINEALPIAEKRVSVSGNVDLVEIFRDVRRTLLTKGKELVMFIEDLTVLHGVEREFLDAIVEPARSDDGDMCNLRVIFAVTEGHFDNLDTVRTRCDDAYWLDSPYGEEGVGLDEALSFLGRYYNAARLSPDVVEDSWARRYNDDWLPNACTRCPYHEPCHSTFGASDEGFGLYPLNASAAGRLMEAVSKNRYDVTQKSRFDPREVVREVVQRFLLQGAAHMHQRRFPSDAELATFDRNVEPMAPLLAAEIRSRLPAEYERAINTLRYWSEGDLPTSTKDAVLTAFGLDPSQLDLPSLTRLTGRGKPAPPFRGGDDRVGPPPPAPQGVADRLGTRYRRYFDELTLWVGQNHDLSMGATNELRNLVHKTVVNNLALGPTPVHLGPEFSVRRFRAERDVGFVGTVTQQDLTSVIIKIDRTNENAAALQGLLLAAELDMSDLSEGALYQRRLAANVEAWTEAVEASLTVAKTQAAISAVAGLIMASAVLGLTANAKSPLDYLEAIFQPLPDQAPEATPRSSNWTRLAETAASIYPRLRKTVETDFGESRGVQGGVRVVQADRLLPLIEAFTSQWQLEGADDPAVATLMRTVGSTVSSELERLKVQVTGTTGYIDRDRSWPEQTDKVLAVLRAAHNAGRLRDPTAIDDLTKLSLLQRDRVQRSFFEVQEAMAKERTLGEKLSLLGSALPGDVGIVHAFATRAVAAVQGVEQDLSERQAAGGRTDSEVVVEKVLESLSRFVDTAKGLAQ